MFGDVLLVVLGAIGAIVLLRSIRVINQVERGIVFRFGRALPSPRQPGLKLLIPLADRMKKVNVQVVTMPVPAQEGITRDNVSVRVDAVVYFRVEDPIKAAIEVQNYHFAIEQVAQTSLRSIIGKSDLDDLLSNREQLHRGLGALVASPAMSRASTSIGSRSRTSSFPSRSSGRCRARPRRSASVGPASDHGRRQVPGRAEALRRTRRSCRSRRARAAAPAPTVVEVATEKNSSLVMPFQVELLRFFEHAAVAAQATGPATSATSATPVAATPASSTLDIQRTITEAAEPDRG